MEHGAQNDADEGGGDVLLDPGGHGGQGKDDDDSSMACLCTDPVPANTGNALLLVSIAVMLYGPGGPRRPG